MVGQYGYVPFGQHLVCTAVDKICFLFDSDCLILFLSKSHDVSLRNCPLSHPFSGSRLLTGLLGCQVLGIYTFTKRVNLDDGEAKPRRAQGYSTVSHFNVIHIECHLAAVRLVCSSHLHCFFVFRLYFIFSATFLTCVCVCLVCLLAG